MSKRGRDNFRHFGKQLQSSFSGSSRLLTVQPPLPRKIDLMRAWARGTECCGMLAGLRSLFSSAPAPYADPKASIPLGEVLRRNWFELWYQPKIELRTMHLVGAEALVRARHPTRGIVPPDLLPARCQRRGHACAHRACHPDGAPRLGKFRALRRADQARGQRAGIRAGRSSNPAHVARDASARGQLAGADIGSHRGPDHRRSRSRQRRCRCAARTQMRPVGR